VVSGAVVSDGASVPAVTVWVTVCAGGGGFEMQPPTNMPTTGTVSSCIASRSLMSITMPGAGDSGRESRRLSPSANSKRHSLSSENWKPSS
jgi:hypothetical protein